MIHIELLMLSMIEIMPLYVFEQASLEQFATTFVTTTRSSSAWTTSSRMAMVH
jgi:hypothetical protein